VSLFDRLFRSSADRAGIAPLYAAAVREARDPAWYLDGGVADTIEGRFEMVSVIVSVVLARLEAEGDEGASRAARLTEAFVDDMDGQLRQQGIGDIVVGKHIGKMMSALGGRLGSYRDALASGEGLEEALVRNLYRGATPEADALAFTSARLRDFHAAMRSAPLGALDAGELPQP
jgi:cytochrome b pre-mRNA-processing protein 3